MTAAGGVAVLLVGVFAIGMPLAAFVVWRFGVEFGWFK
ncbi:hypothetical protein MAXJ12_13036 [Mesorhizobium alhagi CCNWXJ12-2]|uniref:Uncharacterized protein n=1 Tax=Mesorhizobium alhagi CCNWXJ12-2 TaxID=1107882 RepID=H0HR24_9HYPH|nr:hypothetical protein MAXJ12_13036 [Mesorhizobium alhagi CCNWXJ12-2]